MSNTKEQLYADTRLVKYLRRRILELQPTKTQSAIAAEAGFRQPNMLAMIKRGSAKLPLDRVFGLAKALDCDPAMLFRLTFDQKGEETTDAAINQIFGTVITENETAWLTIIRDASDNSDPAVTANAQAAVHPIFGR